MLKKIFGNGYGRQETELYNLVQAMTPVLNTPPEVIRGFNSLVFHFLWKDKVTRCFSYAPYDLGGLKMIDYENMVKAMRLSWLKRIFDENCTGFWKSYLDHSLGSYGGLCLFNCNYDPNKLNISSVFYYFYYGGQN